MKSLLKITLLTLLPFAVTSQETINLDLSEVVRLAQSDAPDALIAETRLSNRNWYFQAFLSGYKPQITFDATLPEFNRSVDRVALPTGVTFFNRTDLFSSAGIEMSQNITQTGGRVFASTELQRLDIFEPTDGKQYFSTPIAVGFEQPLFGYNALKWNKKIEPLRYEEATKAFAEEMEGVAYRTVELFFNVFTEQLNVTAADFNKANADTLYNISTGRFSVGKIAETELLQIELSAMNANANLAQAVLNLQSSTERLRNFLGIKSPVQFALTAPDLLPEFEIDAENALKYALTNRSEVIGYQRRLLQAESEVAQAKAESGATVNLRGSIGLTKTSKELSDTYTTPYDDYQRASLRVSVPLADWGAGKAQLKVAQSNQDLEVMNVEQERVNFEQEILLNVQQFDLVRNQVALAKRAYDVSIKREDITRKRYYIGKIGITDLNIAISDMESARRNYIETLRVFWLAYYDIRRITLYDFEKGEALIKAKN
ncbi:MAG: outer membrane protein [Paraglaciecola sp.]|jgi:outer membrane protein